MHARIFLFFLLCSFAASAQSYSVQIDSLTSQYTARFARGQQFPIDSILAARRSSEWLKRIDTVDFDYAFIDEIYDGQPWVLERYFNEGDTLPRIAYMDGEESGTLHGVYYGPQRSRMRWNTFGPMIGRYSGMQPNQELDYEKTQYCVTIGCIVDTDADKEAQFRLQRQEVLKGTYAIRTFIDKKNKKMIVSVQNAPLHPEFDVEWHNYGVSF